MQINSCRSIGDRSLQQEPTKYNYGQLWTVSTTRYDFPYHAVRHGAAYLALTTNNASLVLNGVGMWKINRQEAAARFNRLYKTRSESSYWRRARDVNRDQICHHKVKRPQWPSLRGIESVFVARGKLLTLYSLKCESAHLPLPRIFSNLDQKSVRAIELEFRANVKQQNNIVILYQRR